MRVTKGYEPLHRKTAQQSVCTQRRHRAATALAVSAVLASTHAHAVDGCKVLLCLAGNWKSVPMCVPTVRQALRDMARGKPFPTCSMSGPGNSATHRWSSAPAFCPPQYTREVQAEGAPIYLCDYRGAVTVNVNGQPWSRVWWTGEDSSTEYFAAAREQLGSKIDPKFDQDHAIWLEAQPSERPDSPHGGY